LQRVERRGAGGTARVMAGSDVRPKARAHEVECLGEGEGGGGSEGFTSGQHARSQAWADPPAPRDRRPGRRSHLRAPRAWADRRRGITGGRRRMDPRVGRPTT